TRLLPKLASLKAELPPAYRIETGGSIEESAKANASLAAVFPVMIIVMLTLLMIQLQSFSRLALVLATAPLGLIGAAAALLIAHKPFGFVALLGLIALAGMSEANVADTLADPSVEEPLPAQPVDPPTLSMTFRINDGPFAGQEGDKVQSRVIRDRLLKEAERNIAIRVIENEDRDSFSVSGRGELQLAILIENMRREGFELTVSRPKVVFETDAETGQRLEPIEEVIIDVDDDYTGVVVQKLSERKGDLLEMRPSGGGRTRMVFHVPTRGLLGYQSELLSDTRGTGIMNKLFHAYKPFRGEIQGRRTGVLISNSPGEAVAYAIFNLQDRGPFMINPQDRVYEGMIVGEHSRENDLEVNVVKGKKLTNVRASGKDEAVNLTPPMRLTLEKAMSYITDEELVEVTPKNIRLRKRWLDPNERKRQSRKSESERASGAA
ncbi:MAG TPA: efflux RND transporter permease subunit, partial [Hyphomicrobium sp.]|nr:efflux RND transporter permease subunit [Hyphomicrobium sp.]